MAPIPLITVGAALIGLTSGIVFRLPVLSNHERLHLFLAVFMGHLTGSVIVKTTVLYGFYGTVALFRIPIYIGTAFLEFILLSLLVKNPFFRRHKKQNQAAEKQ